MAIILDSEVILYEGIALKTTWPRKLLDKNSKKQVDHKRHKIFWSLAKLQTFCTKSEWPKSERPLKVHSHQATPS